MKSLSSQILTVGYGSYCQQASSAKLELLYKTDSSTDRIDYPGT
eukprot:COSAG01_NODE_47702_length_387_cov_10.857639_1_plen_43_part_01